MTVIGVYDTLLDTAVNYFHENLRLRFDMPLKSLPSKCKIRYRSSRSQIFFKIGALKNFAKFSGNTCARVSFLIKLQASA